jgi:two-component system cell cycle sensor histidine kinase/response regulator CckA
VLSTTGLFRCGWGQADCLNPDCDEAQRSRADDCESVVRGRDVVLVADDDPRVRRLLVTLLRQVGFAVVDAANGWEGLERVAGIPRIDLVVADLSMPEMSGTEMVRRLRLERPGLKALYLTDNTNATNAQLDSHLALARDLREAYLPKPFTLNGLCDAVSSLLHSSTRPTRATL